MTATATAVVATTLREGQSQVIRIDAIDNAGNADTVTIATWKSSSPAMVEVSAAAGIARTAKITATKKTGVAIVTATCGDATLTITVTIATGPSSRSSRYLAYRSSLHGPSISSGGDAPPTISQ